MVSFDTVDIMICEEPAASGDPQLLRHFGIEPTLYDLIVVKANTSFLVSYGAFAGDIYYADTPGVCAANLKSFHWERLPRTVYPFALPVDYQIEPAKIHWDSAF